MPYRPIDQITALWRSGGTVFILGGHYGIVSSSGGIIGRLSHSSTPGPPNAFTGTSCRDSANGDKIDAPTRLAGARHFAQAGERLPRRRTIAGQGIDGRDSLMALSARQHVAVLMHSSASEGSVLARAPPDALGEVRYWFHFGGISVSHGIALRFDQSFVQSS